MTLSNRTEISSGQAACQPGVRGEALTADALAGQGEPSAGGDYFRYVTLSYRR
jgi:hypothetical protein